VKTILISCCIASLCVMARPAHADTVSFQFSGSVAQVPVDDVFGDIALGETFQGSLSFDSSATDLVPGDASIGSYTFSSPFGMTVSIGVHNFKAQGSLDIEVLNSFVDQFTVLATSQTGGLTMDMFLLDNGGSAFTDDHLPLGLPPLADFAERDFHLDGFLGDGEIQIEGEIGVPATQAVPEPSSIILLTTISAVIFAVAYRRRSPRDN
jgi:hypothetical protein